MPMPLNKETSNDYRRLGILLQTLHPTLALAPQCTRTAAIAITTTGVTAATATTSATAGATASVCSEWRIEL